MENKKKILVADANNRFCAYLERELNSQPDLIVVGVATDGVDAVRQIETQAPDVVLMDIVLPVLDGIGVLRDLGRRQLQTQPLVLVMTCFVTEMMEAHIAALGAHYLLVKPFEVASLVELLRHHAGPAGSIRIPGDKMARVTEMLLDMGVPTSLKGFPYTREAIILTVCAEEDNTGITKFIYPEVAKKYATTASRVERAIRHAIDVAWERGDIDAHYRLFRNSVNAERGRPTNAEFIATLAEKLSLQENAPAPGIRH